MTFASSPAIQNLVNATVTHQVAHQGGRVLVPSVHDLLTTIREAKKDLPDKNATQGFSVVEGNKNGPQVLVKNQQAMMTSASVQKDPDDTYHGNYLLQGTVFNEDRDPLLTLASYRGLPLYQMHTNTREIHLEFFSPQSALVLAGIDIYSSKTRFFLQISDLDILDNTLTNGAQHFAGLAKHFYDLLMQGTSEEVTVQTTPDRLTDPFTQEEAFGITAKNNQGNEVFAVFADQESLGIYFDLQPNVPLPKFCLDFLTWIQTGEV